MDKAEQGRQQLLELLGEAGGLPIDEVITSLTYCEVGVRPAVPLAVVLARPDDFRGRLLEELALSPAEVDERLSAAPDDRHAYFLHTFAVYLLALWQEPRAYAPLIAYLTADPDTANDQLGDTVTEDLPAILGRIYDGSDLTPLKALIESPSIDPFLRSACLRGLHAMARYGKVPEAEVIAYFETLAVPVEASDAEFLPHLAMDLAMFQQERLRPMLEGWFAPGALGDGIITKADIDATYRADYATLNEELTRRERFDGLIDDLCDWPWFNVADPSELSWSDDDEGYDVAEPFVREGRKIGRNEPCPCGSGKKYKKCCLDKELF